MYGTIETAERSVFVLDDDEVVTYKWIRERADPHLHALTATLRDEVGSIVTIDSCEWPEVSGMAAFAVSVAKATHAYKL